MVRFILKRFVIMLFMLALLSVVVFVIIQLPPGGYAARMWPKRYWRWITNIVLHGNLGASLMYRLPVTMIIGERIGFTAILALAASVLTYGLAIPIGIYSAIHQYSVGDYFFSVLSYIGMATPNFLLALLIAYISVTVFGTSVGGLFSPEYQEALWSWGRFVDMLKHLWVPALILGSSGIALQARTVRAALLDEKNNLYVTAARAKGLSERRLLFKYPLRMALNPIASTFGWELTSIISGAPIIGFVLALPDIGPVLLRALLDQDVYLAGTILLALSALTIIGTSLSDILLALLDPRIRQGERI